MIPGPTQGRLLHWLLAEELQSLYSLGALRPVTLSMRLQHHNIPVRSFSESEENGDLWSIPCQVRLRGAA